MSARAPRGAPPVASSGAASLTSIGLGLAPAPRGLPSHLLPNGGPPGAASPGDRQESAGPGRPTRQPLVAECRFALAVLGAALAGVYLFAGGQLIGRATGTAMVALAVGLAQAAWAVGVVRGARRALIAGAVVNLLMVGAWAVSHASGLTGGPQPIGVLDALCAADSVAITLLAGGVVLGADRLARSRTSGLLVHLPILLAAASLSALAGGHTHSGAGGPHVSVSAPTSDAAHFSCRLL